MWHIGVPPSATGSTQTGVSQGISNISPVASSGMYCVRVSIRAGALPISVIDTSPLPANGPRTDELLDAWARADIEQPDLCQPQRVLQRIIENGDYSVADLDARLCWIFDRSPQIYGPQDPIIEHLQASREYRHPDRNAGNLLAARQARIKELEGVNLCEPK